nr:hypothetical protein CFP56_14618 [Quercus suber]
MSPVIGHFSEDFCGRNRENREVDNDGEDGGFKEETIDFVREKVAEVKAKGGGEGSSGLVVSGGQIGNIEQEGKEDLRKNREKEEGSGAARSGLALACLGGAILAGLGLSGWAARYRRWGNAIWVAVEAELGVRLWVELRLVALAWLGGRSLALDCGLS